MALIEIDAPQNSAAVDPGTYPQPTPNAAIGPADPTNNANRYTVNVPTEATTLSMGAAQAGGTLGITGSTDSHVHFYVGAPQARAAGLPAIDPAAQTMVSLGIARSTLLDDGRAFAAGYFLDTQGEAYHRSVANQHVESTDARVGVSAPDAVNLETDGFISLSAGADMKRGAFYDGFLDQIKREHLVTLGILAGMVGLGIKLYKPKHKPLDGKPGYRTLQWKDAGKFALKLAFLADHTYTLANGWDKEEDPGKISLFAKKAVSIVGDASVALSGRTSTSTAMVSASMAAPLTVVKGYALLQMWSLYTTTVNGLFNVRLKSDLGSAKVVGKTHAELTSRDGKAFVMGHKDVQINSNEGQVFAHGKQGVFVGAGSGPVTETYFGGQYMPALGMGLVVKPTWLKLGRVSDATSFKDPKIERPAPNISIWGAIGEEVVSAENGTTRLQLTTKSAALGFGECGVNFNAGRALVKAPRIMLG